MNREGTARKRRAETVHEIPPPRGTFKRSVWDQVSTLTTPGFVYFVQAEIGGLVKIGWATKPAERVRNMQRWCPVKLTILFSVPGDGKMEAELHRRFKSARQHGEWFEPVPEIFGVYVLGKQPARGCGRDAKSVDPLLGQADIGRRESPNQRDGWAWQRTVSLIRSLA